MSRHKHILPFIVPIVVLPSAIALGAFFFSPGGPEIPERMLVLVVLDTVRADALPLDGQSPERAPFIADLARRSAVFDNAFSTSSWTAPSTASIFTGLYPPEHGVIEGFRAQQRAAGTEIELDDPDIELRSLPQARPTLPELLQRAGWRTIGAAGNLNIGTELGFDRGFDHFVLDRTANADTLADRVRGFLEERDPRPVFLYLHLNDAHHPYEAREPYYRKPKARKGEKQARYASEIAAMDDALRELYEDLEWESRADIVLVSDHGEAFGEHGDEGHIFSLYGEVNRVAMLVSGDRSPQGRIESPASLVDIRPTLLDLAGVADEAPGPGRSLLPAIRGQSEGLDERVLFAHRASPRKETTLWAAIRGQKKLLVEHGAEPSYSLFDLSADPGESRDVKAEQPEDFEALRQALSTFQQAHAQPGEAVSVPVDEALYRELEALGYIEP